MTTVKTFLVVGSCGLVLLGTVAAQAMGLSYARETNGKPNCFASSDVRVIPFSGTWNGLRGPCPPPEEELPED